MQTVKSDSKGHPQVYDIKATTLTRAGLVATFTATKAHKLATGQLVQIRGADLAAFNTLKHKPVVVTVTSTTVFTYPIPVDPGANAVVTNVIAQRQLPGNEYDPFLLVDRKTGRLHVIDGASLGAYGFEVIADTTDRTVKTYGVLLPVTDVVINTLTSDGMTGSLNGVTLKAGVAYPVPVVSQIQLTSGTLLAYNWSP